MGEGLLLVGEQSKWFLEMESTPGEDAVRTVEMTREELNLTDNTAGGLDRTDSKLGRSSIGKMLSNSLACYREIWKGSQDDGQL